MKHRNRTRSRPMILAGLLATSLTLPITGMCQEGKYKLHQEEQKECASSTCSVCLEVLGTGKPLQLPASATDTIELKACAHQFHFGCIAACTNKCPLCRSEFPLPLVPKENFMAKCIALADKEIELEITLDSYNFQVEEIEALTQDKQDITTLNEELAAENKEQAQMNKDLGVRLLAQANAMNRAHHLELRVTQLKDTNATLNALHDEHVKKLIHANTELTNRVNRQDRALERSEIEQDRLEERQKSDQIFLAITNKLIESSHEVWKTVQKRNSLLEATNTDLHNNAQDDTQRIERLRRNRKDLSLKLKHKEVECRNHERAILDLKKIVESQQKRLAPVFITSSRLPLARPKTS